MQPRRWRSISGHFSDCNSGTSYSYTTPTTNTPFESCNISPSESCQVSRELNPDEYFFQYSTEVSGFIGDNPKKSWTRKLKLIKQSTIGSKLKASRDYLKSLFSKSGCSDESCAAAPRNLDEGSVSNEKKALTEVKSNTRTLAMVLRSERELLSQNKEQEGEITELKMMLEGKNREVEKLKDLCLKQREEIKALKSAVLFPDVMNSQFQELLEKQGSELKQAKQLIPSLQRQVTSLTGQLHCLAEDLAEVKADKYSVSGCYDAHVSSPKTPAYDQEDGANSLEFSSWDHTIPCSPDDMFLKDLNPCLTPYYAKTKTKEYVKMAKKTTPFGQIHTERYQMPNTTAYTHDENIFFINPLPLWTLSLHTLL